MKRFLWSGLVLSLYLICTGCGDTFRPIIIPNPPVFPNPKAAHTVVSINDNGTAVAGTAMVIDVSGDTEVSIANVGLAPVQAVQQSSFQVLVVNHSVTGSIADSLTELTFGGATTISSAFTITLPPNSAPSFAAVAPSSTTAYVTLPNYLNPTTNTIVPSVGVVSTVTDSLQNPPTITVGNNPVALAVTPNNTKLYVANQGDSTISGFNTVDRSQRVGSPVTTSSPPIWLVARSDNQRVFFLEASGTLGWLDTTSTAGPDGLSETSITVPAAAKLVYDGNLNRIYVPGGAQVAIVDATQPATSSSLLIANVPITTVAPGARVASDPCSATTATTLNTVDVAALPDGSRAYAGSFYEAAVGATNYICPQVTVIDVASNTAKPPVAIPGFAAYDDFCAPNPTRSPRFRIMMAAGGDSSRAYLSSCDGGSVNVIDTSTDSYLLNLQAPISSRSVQGSTFNPPQNPIFLLAGP